MNEEELEELFDLLEERGSVVDVFRTEFRKIQDEVETTTLAMAGHERDMTALMTELSSLRENVGLSKRVLDESLTFQDNVRAQTESFQSRIRDAAVREMANKSDSSIFEDRKEELLSALSVGSDWREDQLEERDNLEKERDFLSQLLDNKTNELNNLRTEMDMMIELIREDDLKCDELDKQYEKANQDILDVKMKTADAMRRKVSAEKSVFDLRKDIVQREVDVSERKRIARGDELLLEDVQRSLESSKAMVEENVRTLDRFQSKQANVAYEVERQKKNNAKVEIENEERVQFCAVRNEESKRHFKQAKKLRPLKELTLEKITEIEEEKIKYETRRAELEKQIEHIEQVELKEFRRENEAIEKQISSLKRELDILTKKVTNSEKAAIAAAELIQANENGKKNLLIEKALVVSEIAIDKEKIQVLMQEKEKLDAAIEVANQRYYTALEEVKLQDLQIKELNTKIAEEQTKLKHKQNLYDAIRSDRNLYSKQLLELQDEITVMRRKFRSMNHLIDQLKDEISSKDHAIVKEHFNHHAVDKEKELLKNEIAKVKKQLYTSDEIVENQRLEVLKLLKIIDDAELERVRQRQEVMAIESEKNLLAGQMMKRNSELKQLYEKIKLMRSNLFIGETQYNKLLEGIGQWQLQLRQLVFDNNDTILSLAGYDDLKKTEVQLEKEIRNEQTKWRALHEELQHPMNIHRWRVLESSDPQRFERIKQIQELQKEVIAKADEVIRTDLLIQEKEKVYLELKAIIARQPGPEVEEQLLTYQLTLKEKTKQLAAMDDELDMYRQQASTYKEDIIDIDRQLERMKKRWLKTKKADFFSHSAAHQSGSGGMRRSIEA
jgi:hypothetical protein